MSTTLTGIEIKDTDHHFVIDALTREISSKSPQKDILVKDDHDSERFTFDIPRFIEGKDVAKCNLVQVCYLNGRSSGVYTVDDMAIDPSTTDIFTCSWLISRNATKHVGKLTFMLRFVQMDDAGVISYAWSTKTYEKVRVLENIDSGEMFEDEYVDVIEQWKNDLEAEMRAFVDYTVETQVDVAQIRTNKANTNANSRNISELRTDVDKHTIQIEANTKNIDTNTQNIAEMTKDLGAQKARMDTFTALGEGSTSGDAELVDIRIGPDGTVYPNAGSAVRGLVSDISGYFVEDADEEPVSIGENLVGGVEWSELGYYRDREGQLVTSEYTTDYRATDLIPITPNKTYRWAGECWHVTAMFYTSARNDGVFMDLDIDGATDFTVPNGKSFVAFNVTGGTLSSVYRLGHNFTLPRLRFDKYLDETLTESGKAADAKVVGEQLAAQAIPFTVERDPDFESPVNELDGVGWSDINHYRTKEGEVVQTQYTGDYVASDFIPVLPNYTYRLYMNGGAQISFMFYSDARNDGVEQSIFISRVGEITIPEGKTCLAINYRYVQPTEMHRVTQHINELDIFIPQLVMPDAVPKSNVGYTIVNMGDSIFGNFQDETSISNQLAQMTGATVYNCAFGGCQMTDRNDTEWRPYSMCNLADAIVSGDFSTQKANADGSIAAIPGYFSEHVNTLASIDFSTVDIVTIAYGTNDFTAADQLTSDDILDKNTVQGALRYAIQTIGAAYPNIRFLVCTPMWRCVFTDGQFDYDSDTWENYWGYKLPDYVEAIKTVANEYHIPVCDYYNEMGLNRYNWPVFFTTSDGVHPIDKGRKLMAKKLADKLAAM